MTNSTFLLCKVKPGKKQVWLDWCAKIMGEHYAEAVTTMAEEDLVQEQCFLFGEGDGYVLYVHTPVEGKVKKPFNPDRELNQEHFRKFHECLEKLPKTDGYNVKYEEG